MSILAELAGDGKAVEFVVGTRPLALPLAEAGFRFMASISPNRGWPSCVASPGPKRWLSPSAT